MCLSPYLAKLFGLVKPRKIPREWCVHGRTSKKWEVEVYDFGRTKMEYLVCEACDTVLSVYENG